MGQSSSQEIPQSSETSASVRQRPPRLKVQPVPRPPSYAVPENKVLPTELPSKPLRAVSGVLSRSNPELQNLLSNKENQPDKKSNLSLDEDLLPGTSEEDNTSLNRVQRKGKYQAPSPPIQNGFSTESSSLQDQFYNRSALAHRRTNSLERLPVIRVSGQPRRPASTLNLTASENTIFEDPNEISHSKNTPLPQKNTFPMDYSYAVTYAQLAGHRRKNLEAKLNSEKGVLLKQQSLPSSVTEPEMDTQVGVGLTNSCEIDLDNYDTPKRKKYRAPAPPSASPASNRSAPLERSAQVNSNEKIKYVSMSKSQSAAPPEEPPADYDTGESRGRGTSVHLNGGGAESPRRTEINIIPVIPLASEDKEPRSIVSKEVHTPKSSYLLRQRQPSPKSPPPPVKPKPSRSPVKGNFVYPTTPVIQDLDVVTVNGQIIPESPNLVIIQKDTVSLRVDSKLETVATSVVTEVPVVRHTQDPNGNFTAPVSKYGEPSQTGQIIISDIAPASPKVNGASSMYGNSSNVSSTSITHMPDLTQLSEDKLKNESLVSPSANSEDIIIGGSLSRDGQKESTARDVKSVPVGFTTDIMVDTSSVGGSSTPILPQSSADSGVTMPLSDQSFESLTTGDRSMELDPPLEQRVEEDSEERSSHRITQSTMTMPLDADGNALSLDRSMSISSSDSAKPASPPLTPDTTKSHPRMMSSILQHDIVSAAQSRGIKMKKPIEIPPRQKSPEEVFKEELAKIHIERESRLKQNINERPVSVNQSIISHVNGVNEKSQEKGDTDSGIQACSFSEDWTPEHDLEDSDDEQQSAHTSRSGLFYEGRRPKAEIKASNSFKSYGEPNGHGRMLKKSDSDVGERQKIGSLRKFRQNVHKGVQQAFNSVNKSSKKPSKLDKRSSLPPSLPSSPDSKPQEPVFRKLDPDSLYTRAPENHREENSSTELKQNSSDKPPNQNGSAHSSSEDVQVQKKTGLAYVGGKVVLLPEFETADKVTTEDGHRAPKRWKKTKKFAYMATTRKKEKQKKEQLLQERIADQERKMEEERQKQLEMEREFMKVRQVDKSELIKLERQLSNNMSSRSTSVDESEAVQENQEKTNGTPDRMINTSSDTSETFTVPSLVHPQSLQPSTNVGNQTHIHPMLLTGANQMYNPWFQSQQMQNIRYQAPVGIGMPNYGMVSNHYTSNSVPGLTNYMQMLDINGQVVNVPINPALMNGYPWSTQSLDRSQNNGAIPYNNPYTMANNIPFHQANSLQANNNYNKRLQKQRNYRENMTIDDSVLNQMYEEYHHGPRQPQTSTSADQKKKRSNPLYFSSDEEEEYEVRDIHTGGRHSAGSVARISVPDHHRPLNNSHDEEMPSPASATSSSGDSGLVFHSQLYTSPTQQKHNYPHLAQNGTARDGVNLDESYSSADR